MSYDQHNVFVKDEFARLMQNNLSIVFELGARDGLYTREINQKYNPDKIYSFECNPNSIENCIKNTKELTNVFLSNLAVAGHVGEIQFFPVVGGACHGSSSIFKLRKVTQTEVTVPCVTLDSFCKSHGIDEIDLICADIEGAETLAFTKQDILNRTKYIITEVQIDPNWKPGNPTIEELEGVIFPYGFERAAYIGGAGDGKSAGDALYINRRLES